MLQRMEAPCPECPDGRLLMEIEIDDLGGQTFPDGEIMREFGCDGCYSAVLVTLNGAGNEPTLTSVPTKH